MHAKCLILLEGCIQSCSSSDISKVILRTIQNVINLYIIKRMTSQRARRILNLISPTSSNENQNGEVGKSDSITLTAALNNKIARDGNNHTKDNEENIAPYENILQKCIHSCDEIVLDDEKTFNSRFISCQADSSSLQNKSSCKTSLVPYDDSDDSFTNDNNDIVENKTANMELYSHFKDASSSLSSSSPNTSSSSSDSDSSASSQQSAHHCQKFSEEELHFVVGDPDNDQSLCLENAPQPSCSYNLRDQIKSSCGSQPINTSAVFTIESDIDLSDDDPTFNYDNLLNNGRHKNYIFESFDSVSTCSSDFDNQESKKGRKRLKNPSKWRQNRIKKLRNTGQSYVTMSNTRKTMPSRCLKVPCTDKCKLKCTENINTHERYNIFSEFWELGDLTKQRTYISNCMTDIIPKYRYTNAKNPRRLNKAYYFTVNKKRVRVCKTFFKSTLDISDRMILTVQTRISDGGFMLDDLRGKHDKHKTLNSELVNDIRKHIQSIPKIESHYMRANSSKEYIEGSKTIKDLYNDFVLQQQQRSKESGNYAAYYKIFTTEFNLSFFRPKKDQCDLCLTYKNSTDGYKEEIEEKYKEHLIEKSLSRTEKKNDRTNITKDTKVIIYDLEAVLQCPRGDISSFYYKSKLNCYNLTLTELTNTNSKTAYDKVHSYFWTESEAKRGAIEIGTCIWQYLQGLLQESPDKKNVIFYSDNCCGQNKNKYIATLYLLAVQKLNVETITHKFLIRGHTQNEADSVHSLIEKEVKKNLKSGPIYSPDQYITLIKNAKKSKPFINVHELTFESFVDLKNLQQQWGYNFNTDTDRVTVNWNKIKVLMVKKEKPFSIFCKTSYKEHTFREIDVRNKRKKMKLISEITLKQAYTEKQDISMNKKKDLKELISKGLIPFYYTNYYNSIIE